MRVSPVQNFGHHAMALGVKSSFVHLIGHNDSLWPEFCTWYGYMNAGAAVGAIESEGAGPGMVDYRKQAQEHGLGLKAHEKPYLAAQGFR